MLPIRDSTPRRTFPIINYSIIIFTIYVFYKQISTLNFEAFILNYGFIPVRFNILDLSSYQPIFTSIFLHGGLFHLISNMWFLHIFGDNIEDQIGHLKYLIFYLIAGLVAVFSQYFLSPSSMIPMIGASGAISGVAGAYFVFFRNSKVDTLVPIFFIIQIIQLPAWFFLGYWFILQLFSGVGSLVTFDVNQGGIAYFAHIGGFVYGYLVAVTLKRILL